MSSKPYDPDQTCSCGHHHEHHHHDKACGCGHEHHHHHGEACGCGHEHHHHHHDETCSCGHEHHHHHHGEACSCGHAHEHGAGCSCGVDHSALSPRRQVVYMCVSLAALIISFLNPAERLGIELLHWLNPAWIAVILCGIPIFKGAWHGLRVEKKINSAVLISVAMTASVVLEFLSLAGIDLGGGHDESYLFAAGEIALLMALGEFLEDLTVRRSRAGIERLVALSPTTARRLRPDGTTEEVEVTALAIGDSVLVQPNSIIPADGVIASGMTSVNQAAMTGESLPVDKAPGDEVFAGTQNLSGALTVTVTKKAGDMAISKLTALVEEAEGKKAPISRVADRWASKIVPAAVVLSIAVGLFAFFVLRVSVPMAIVRGVTILVVFCPCALALATPTAVAAGLGNAASRGLLIKSGAALEEAAKVDLFAFDKTGTLTEGRLAVDGLCAFGMDETELLRLAGAAEKHSEHPIARAVVDCAAQRVEVPEPGQTDSLMGVGVRADVDGRQVLICKWDEEKLAPTPDQKARAEQWLQQGKTLCAVVVDGRLAGLLAVSDVLRPEAREAVSALRSLGVSSVMLTGDNGATAARIADAVGLSHYEHSLMPDQKLEKIEQMRREGRHVCMVGDGVNDAPALATADCSVAMGALGSDVAVETASVALMSSDIRRLPGFIALSRRVMTTIRANIALSIGVNILAVILSTVGTLTPVTGALVHNASSILVVLNSSVLLTVRDKWVR